jgi:hypothetical protein
MTPDPYLDHPNWGQRILVQWILPKEYLKYENLNLKMTVRFYNRKEETIELSIKKLKGVYFYNLLKEAYCTSGGIATYKVEILGDGCCLEIWKHPLWNELILINAGNETVSPTVPSELTEEK